MDGDGHYISVDYWQRIRHTLDSAGHFMLPGDVTPFKKKKLASIGVYLFNNNRSDNFIEVCSSSVQNSLLLNCI